MRRRRMRSSLAEWSTEALRPLGLKPAAHHLLLIHELEAVARGETKRLMVLMPPGSAKSTYASDLFPAWYLAQHPNRRIIAASNTADLAGAFSRRVRGRVREHGTSLGYSLSREAEELWSTTNGGEYRAAGVGGIITGLRADLGLIDDPVKGRQEADSEVSQQRVWDWYWGDFHTRLKPGAAQVLIMTRWSEGDLGGRLEEAEGDRWRILRLPAIAEPDDLLGRAPGEFLWGDDEYGFGAKLRDDFQSLTNAGRTRDWSALYQQRPSPETGDYFRKEWLRPSPSMPERSTLRVYGASDYAVTQDGGDYTVHVVVGVDPDRRLWLLDMWRGQANSMTWVEAFCDLVRQWKPIGWAEETGQIKSGVGPFLEQRMRQRQAFVARTQFPTRGDKAIRAQSIRGRMALDGLYIPQAAPWRADLEAEMMGFPAGKHDDQVDALGLLGQLLDKMAVGDRPKPAEKPRDSWDAAFGRANADDADGWRVA
jgi:predicted phage terminase large subunit-like protein